MGNRSLCEDERVLSLAIILLSESSANAAQAGKGAAAEAIEFLGSWLAEINDRPLWLDRRLDESGLRAGVGRRLGRLKG